MQTYIVKSGDTLYGISKQFGVSIDELKKINNLTSNNLFINQALMIPTMETTILYIVKPDDTLYKIANFYNVSVDELIDINGLKSDNIYPNQEIRIPINGEKKYTNYIVKSGDSLYSIAKKNNISVDVIKDYNNLSSNLLSIGQVLKIPEKVEALPNEFITYTVKSGDSLYSIAKNNNISVDDLKELNNLSSNLLSIGQVLKIKETEDIINPNIKECFGNDYTPPLYTLYTVKSGDNLYSIARKYNTNVDDLKQLNNLSSNNLQIGQILKIREV